MKPTPPPPPSAAAEPAGFASTDAGDRLVLLLGRILARRWLLERDGLPAARPDEDDDDAGSNRPT